MTREEGLRKFILDWKIDADRENLVSAAYERGWSNGYDKGRAEAAEASQRQPPHRPGLKSALAAWARFARARRRLSLTRDPRSVVVEMIWSAGDDRRAWDEIHEAVEYCALLVHRGELYARGGGRRRRAI